MRSLITTRRRGSIRATASAVVVIALMGMANIPAAEAAHSDIDSWPTPILAESTAVLEPEVPGVVDGPGELDRWKLTLTVLDYGDTTPRLTGAFPGWEGLPEPSEGSDWLTVQFRFTYQGQEPISPPVAVEDFTLWVAGPDGKSPHSLYPPSFGFPPSGQTPADGTAVSALGFHIREGAELANLYWTIGGSPQNITDSDFGPLAAWLDILPDTGTNNLGSPDGTSSSSGASDDEDGGAVDGFDPLEPGFPATVAGPGPLDQWVVDLQVMGVDEDRARVGEMADSLSESLPEPAVGNEWLVMFVSLTYTGDAPLAPLLSGSDFTLLLGGATPEGDVYLGPAFSLPGEFRPTVNEGTGLLVGFQVPEERFDGNLYWHPGGLPSASGSGDAEVIATWVSILQPGPAPVRGT